MNERRMSLGNRVISLVLALVMVIGMMPAGVLSVFAADTTGNPDVTSNADTILEYAQGKLDDNHDKTGAFTWDTEGKSDGWRYFNGVMLEAFLQNGLKVSDTETAYSFAQNFFSHYINESGSSYNDVLNGEYSSGATELDGVPPARNLAQLVGHVGFTDDKYANAVKVLYTNTIGQETVDNTGGNFIHKENNSSWANWKVGLDGVYMAQPFLMEVAKAVKEGRVDVGDTYTEIADGVYNRLYWIANNMKYETSDGVYLYHHGWGPGDDYKNGNGITWSRGTGWWVAGLADCIALMEDIGYDSTKIATLKTYLKEAIDGLLKYQHSSGLWYNVIYEQGEGTTTSNNFLEISGTGLFAYTIMKAYTRGWLTDAKYGQAALNAIDGIMGSSSYYSSGSFKNILKSSGVGTTVSYYNSDKSEDEAKGVGPIIMAASMYDDVKAMVSGGSKYTETFAIGDVYAPAGLTVPVGATAASIDYTDILVTVVGSKGTIKDITVSTGASFAITGDTSAAGTAEVTAYYGENPIGTFQVNVVDPTVPAEGEGSLDVEEEIDEAPSAPAVTAGTWKPVTTSSGKDQYYRVGTLREGYEYILTRDSDSNSAGSAGVNSSGSLTGVEVDTNGVETENAAGETVYELTGTLVHWKVKVVNSKYIFYTEHTGTPLYFQLTSNGSSNIAVTTTESAASQFTVTSSGSGTSVTLSASTTATDGKTAYIKIDGKGFQGASSANAFRAYEKIPAAASKYGMLSGTATYAYPVGTTTDILEQIKSDYTIYTNTTNSGTGTSVAWTDSTVTTSWDTTLDVSEAGTYTLSVKLDNVEVGKIPVLIYGNTVVNNYDVNFAVTPGTVVAAVGDEKKQLNVSSFTVGDLNGIDYDVKYSGGNSSVATVSEDGLVTIVGEGTTSITATVTAITYDGVTYDADDFGSITATIPVLVTDGSEHIHSYTSAVTKAATCTVAGVRTYTCSGCEEGTEGHSYTEAIAATGHSWNAGEVTENATCNEAGTKTFTCTACGETKTETIAATGEHTYVNGTCSVCGTSDPGYEAPGIVNIVAGSNTTGKATIQVDGTLQLTANTVGGATIRWSSADDGIATVSNTGLVTGKSVGTVIITATVTNAVTRATNSATFEVTVTAADDSGSDSATGNIKDYTGNPPFTPGDYVEIVAPSTSTTDDESTNYTGSTSGTNTWVQTVVGSTDSDGSTVEYVLYSSKDNSSVPAGNYIIVYSTDGTTGKALTNVTSDVDGGTVPATPTDVTIAGGKITSTINGYIVWTVGDDSYVGNGNNYLQDGQNTKLLNKKSSANSISFAVDSGTTDGWLINVQSDRPMGWGSSNNFERLSSGTTGVNVFLFKETTVESTSGTGTESEYAKLVGSATYSLDTATNEYTLDTLLDQIQEDYKIHTNTTNSGDGTAIAWDDTYCAWEDGADLTEAGEYTLTITYKTKVLGTITVAVNTTTEGTTTTIPGVYAKLDGTEGLSYDMHLPSTDIVGGLKASSNLKVLVANNANGTGATELPMSDSKVSVVKPEDYQNTLAGTYYFDVFYDADGSEDEHSAVKIGSVPVYVNGEATLAVSPSSATVAVNGNQTLTPAITVEGVEIPSGEYTITWETTDAGVATVENGVVTGVASGNATITATLTKVTVTNKAESDKKHENTLDTPISVQIPVTVSGEAAVTAESVALSYTSKDVENGGTVDLSDLEFTVTYSDGSTKTFKQGDTGVTIDTADMNAIDTTVAGNHQVDVKYEEGDYVYNGKVTVTVKEASGGDTPSSGNIYTHNFSTDKDDMSDADKYFTISGSKSNGGTVDGVTYDQGLKLQSSAGTVSFKATNPGTLTLHVGNSAKTVKVNGTAHTVTNGVVTVDLVAGTHTITKGDGEGYLFYVEYAEENVEPEYSATISGSTSILGGDSTELTAQMLLGEDAVDGATYEWTVEGAESYAINGNTVTVKASNAEGNITVSVVATSGENTAEASHTVTVSPVSASVSGADSVYVGDSATYTATVSPNRTFGVTWSVTNGTGSATIDAATGELTGGTAGTVTVTATITEIGGSKIGATASKTVTVQENTYTVTFNDAGINEGVTANLSNYVTVTKNGAAMTSGYTLVFTVDGAANDGSYTGEAVDANATHTVGVKLMIGENEVASDEGTLTVYDTDFHDTGLWSTEQTNTATVVEGGKLTFTLSGDLAAGYWGFLDNLKLYKADGTEVSITNGDFESGITGWTVTGFSATPTSDSKAEANKTNRLNLWISDSAASTGTATFTVTGLDAGKYYFTYDILNGTDDDSTVTGTATATEAVKSNVTVTTGGVTGEAGTYNLVTSLETDTPYVFVSDGSSDRNPTVTENDSGVLSFTSSVSYETWNENDDGTYTPANTTTPTFWYIDADGHLYTLNSKGVKYYVQDGLTSLDTEPGTYVWSLETISNNTYLKITNNDGTRYARAKSDCMESKGDYSTAGVVLAYTPSVTSGEETTTEYLVEAIPQNLTVEAGSSVDPAITLTGKDMDGNTVTVTGTLSYAPANTGIAVAENGKIKGVSAGSTTVTATLINVSINGKTGAINEGATISATFNVTVTPAPVSRDEWIHNVTTDGATDADGFYTISKGSGEASTSSTSRTYGDLSFDTAIKMESSTEIAFTAPNDGTFTMIFRTSDAGKGITINGTDYTIGSDGVLTIDVEKGTEYTITKDDSVQVFYLEYASALVDGLTLTEPGTIYMYVEGASSSAATHVMEYAVRHGEADVTSNSSAYTIAWSSDNESVATVSGGTISGIKPGTANITATVTMSDGTQYTATVPVKVEGATIGTTDELELMVDVEGKKTGTIGSNVHADGKATEEFTVGYLSSDTNVATVDENGTVTAVGVGSATIYTYLKTVNGHTVYSGIPTVATLPEQYATTVVTVTQKEITDAHLNSYDYVIQKDESGDKSALYELLEYKPDVVGSVHGEEGVKLTITYNTGETIVAKFADTNGDGIDDNYAANGYGLQIDLDSIDMTQTGIQIAVVTYTDAEENELFRDSIWIHVEEYDPKDYDGTMTYEGNIRYELDIDGIEPNYEYVIVADRDTTNGTGVAFMNPDTQSQASSTASGNSVVITTENGAEIITIASGADASVWLFDTYNLNVACPDGKARTQLNISNSQRYVGPGEAQNQLIHGNVAHVYLETVDASTGAYYIILGFSEDNAPYYLAYEDGAWHATTTANTLYLYNKHADVQDYGVKYDLYDKDSADIIKTAELIEGKSYDKLNPKITWGGSNTAAESYTIVWSSSDESVATVDQNGKVTALKEGTATITATLYDVNGFDVICNIHDTPYMTKAVTVNVITDNATPTLTPSYLEIGQGSMPNLEKVNIEMSYGEGSENNYFVDHNLLNFRMADATNSAGEVVGFDSTTIDTYTVPVDYADKTYNLTIKVVEDPYAGLEPADSIPGYPDAGSVRMDKIAEAVLDFATTGVTKIELTAAGVSTKNSVDVILIVDVSNSMSWDINNSSNTTDAKRIPTDGVDGVTKLDTAMDVADSFASILLTVPGGDNTITFVTFAGQNGTTDDYVDSVRTPMVGVSNYDTASAVFGATEFTALTVDGDSVKCTLNIGGYTGNGYGDASVSGTNRGNTNYDFAFGQAIDAIADLKAQYAANNDGASYDDSGRQIQVVFMTDGAPSHYNSKKANGSADTLWSGSDKYTQDSDIDAASWLTYMKNYNVLATDLFALADGFYVVGFDMDAGGFAKMQWGLADMTRVLEGLVKNTALPVETADDNAALTTYFTNLAKALAYPGTNAKVTDRIGNNFTLFTGAHMYSDDITEPYVDENGETKQIMSEAILTEMQGKSFPITVASYRLVVFADIGTELEVINEDGTTSPVTVTKDHLGLRVAGEENVEILETITFSADGTQAFSSELGSENILVDDLDKMVRTIDASTFTYTATISPITNADGKVTGYHADQENIIWKIDTIEDHELSMSYYAYLEGSLDNPRVVTAGSYATNEYAYLEYIDVYGKYVKRDYGVPQIAWGAGNVTVRFYLVNDKGDFVNRAGVVFTNPANRIFLNGRAQYEAELNGSVSFTAADALLQAGLAGSNILYDVTAVATVTNSTTKDQGGVSWIKNSSLTNINSLLTYTDSSNGYFTSVVIDIPVVMTDLGESDQKMSDTTVVIDYSNSVQWDALSDAERAYDGVIYNDVQYTIELVGFAKYNSAADLKDYVQQANWPTTYSTDYGTYELGNGGDDYIKFTPKAMLSGADHVFAVFKFENLDKDNIGTEGENMEYYYMYKQVNVVPATVVHYETTGNMGAAFTSIVGSTAWSIESVTGAAAGDSQSNANAGYGYDDSYNNCVNFAGGSSLYVENTDSKATRPSVKFTFTGTGIDIISKTDPDQGRIKMTLTGKNTGTKKTAMVLNKGVDNLYQIPVLSVEGLPYDTYEVEIVVYSKTSAYGGQFHFDAINVYGSAQESEVVGSNAAGNITVGDLYEAAGESSPQIVEIRDILLGNNNFGDISVEGVNGAVYIDGNTSLGDTSTNFNNYDKIGPNNEVYLSNNQAVAFKLRVEDLAKLPTTLDIGLKSVNGSAAKAIIYVYKTGASDTTPAEYTVTTATAMFYDILGGEDIKTFLGDSNEFYVVIANKSTGTLSVTDLKVGYGVAKGNVETVVDITVGDLTQDTLKQSAQVVSVAIANMDTTTDPDTAVAYAMYTTTIVVVTGQDAQSIDVLDSQGNAIAVNASYVDSENGARRWRVLVRFDEVGTDTYTVYGVGTDGSRHDTYQEITVDVRLFAPATTNE